MGTILSVTTLDPDLSRVLEPRASSPARRLAAVETLARAGVPVGVMLAPIIPGLTDVEMPAILKAGEAVAFTGLTLHRSKLNHTDQPRRAFFFEYCDPASVAIPMGDHHDDASKATRTPSRRTTSARSGSRALIAGPYPRTA